MRRRSFDPLVRSGPGGRRRTSLAIAALCALLLAPGSAAAQERRAERLGPEAVERAAQAVPLLAPSGTFQASPIMRQAVASLERLTDDGVIDSSVTLTALLDHRPVRLAPVCSEAVDSRLSEVLAGSFQLALAKVQGRRECAGLFEYLGANGAVMLATTIYLLPSGSAAPARCRRGATAVTTLGSPVTFLCPCFTQVSRREGAIVLLHEALHYAGLSEQPLDPAGLTPQQISAMVASACRL